MTLNFDKQICRNLIMSTPELYKAFQKYLDIPNDKFGHIAVTKTYLHVVLPNTTWRTEYERRVAESKYAPPTELTETITRLIHDYGWQMFFVSLRFLVIKWRRQELNNANLNKLSTTIDKLGDIPQTIKVRKTWN